MMLTETALLISPHTPGGQQRLESHSWGPDTSAGWELTSSSDTLVSRTVVVSTQGPAPRKAGTSCRNLPLADHTSKEDVEQGMPKGRVRGAKGTTTFIPRGMGDEKGRK